MSATIGNFANSRKEIRFYFNTSLEKNVFSQVPTVLNDIMYGFEQSKH